MTVLIDQKAQISTTNNDAVTQLEQSHSRQALQQKIQTALQIAKELSPHDCLKEIGQQKPDAQVFHNTITQNCQDVLSPLVGTL